VDSKISAIKIVYAYYLFLGFFVNFGVGESDVSVIYFGIVLLSSFLSGYRLHNKMIYTGVMSVILAMFIILEYPTELSKSLIAVLLGSHLYWEIMRIKPIVSSNILRNVAIIHLSFAFVSLIDTNFLDFLFYRVGSDSSRGATGLAPEPSYLGLTAVFLTAISLHLKAPRVTIIFFILTTLASMSMYALLMLILVFCIYLSWWKITLTTFLIIIGLYSLFPDKRFTMLGLQFVENGLAYVVWNDSSIAYRLRSLIDFYNGVFSLTSISAQGLNGGVSRFTVHLGAFGLLLLIIIIAMSPFQVRLLKSMSNIFILLATFVVMFIGPVSLPAFYLWLGFYQDEI